MTAQTEARAVLASIRARGVANSLSAGTDFLRDRIVELRARPVANIRAAAAEMMERAKQAFSQATGVAWYAGLAVRYANYARWKPYQALLDDAALSLQNGDNEQTDEAKKERYIRCWVTAGQAIDGIAKESGAGETDLSMVLDAGWERAKDEIGPRVWSPIWWLCGGLLAYEVFRK